MPPPPPPTRFGAVVQQKPSSPMRRGSAVTAQPAQPAPGSHCRGAVSSPPGGWTPRRLVSPASPFHSGVHPAANRPGPATAQAKFTRSETFSKHKNLSEVLDGVQSFLEADKDFKWLIDSKLVEVHFTIGVIGGQYDAHGITELILNGDPVNANIFLKPEKVLQLLNSGKARLGLRVTIDRDAARNEALGALALAHEVGAHVRPKIKLLRKVAERNVSGLDLAQEFYDYIRDVEHTSLYHADISQKPENSTYFQLVIALKTCFELLGKKNVAGKLVELYCNDVTRYEKHDEINPSLVVAAQNLQKQKMIHYGNRCCTITGVMAVVVIFLLLFYVIFMRSSSVAKTG